MLKVVVVVHVTPSAPSPPVILLPTDPHYAKGTPLANLTMIV